MQTLEELILISVGANANSVGDDILSSRVGANACGALVGADIIRPLGEL